MSAKPEETAVSPPRQPAKPAAATSAAGSPRVASSRDSFLIAGAGERLNNLEGVEIVRTIGRAGEPVAVARMSVERATQLAAAGLVIEPDTLAPAVSSAAVAVDIAAGPGFSTVIQVSGPDDQPLERAEVHLIGARWSAHGLTGADGRVALSLFGETPDSVAALVVKPRAGHWSQCLVRPRLLPDATHAVTLSLLPATSPTASHWGGKALGLDQLPAEWRGKGVRIAIVDTGIQTANKQLARVSQGLDIAGGKDKGWAQDPSGHGTLVAGIIGADSEAGPIRGWAPEAELLACKIPAHPQIADLVAALDHCLAEGVDIAVIGLSAPTASAILEQRLAAAKRAGIAVIAAAGDGGGAVRFPASSPHVLAVGAVGRRGEYPADSLHAAHGGGSLDAGALFSPAFTAAGSEIDVCAPGVAVLSAAAPDGIVAADGTALAAAHTAALAALILAHHPDFQGVFAQRDGRRVERLFQIIKETAQPLALDPARSGAGLPDARRALGLAAVAEAGAVRTSAASTAGMPALRNAMQLAGLSGLPSFAVPRGPAVVGRSPLTPAVLMGGVKVHLEDLRVAMALAGLPPS